jgi:dihydrofolate reductase
VPRTRVHNLFVSLDGYAAGEEVTFDAPIGHARQLFGWFDGRVIHGIDKVDDPVTLDRALFSTWGQGIGAEIMGRRKFGPQTGEWPDDGWRGWWGEEPAFRTPCFVMTHWERPPLVLGQTTFHFVSGEPAEVLKRASEAAGGLDVRLGGGPTTVNEFLAADLVDYLHVIVVPILLGRGVRLWDGLEGLHERYTVESTTLANGATHLFFSR